MVIMFDIDNSDVCMAWCLYDIYRLKHYNTTQCKVERNWGTIYDV